MAKRKSLNRVSRRYSKRRSVDSFGSGHLDPDTFVVDEERTFWWNNLEENTFPPHSIIHSENETSRMLNANSRIDSSQNSDPTEWWKNLDSDTESIASKPRSSRRSAAIVKSRILQTSTETSESEKELNLRKKKVRLKASNRKSINNAFANALNDTETTTPLKSRKKQVHSEIHIDSVSESLQGRSQENEEDSNSSPTSKILKSKPSIFRTRRGRGDGMKDQNIFQDVLMENNVLNTSTAKTSVVFEKESSQHLMHRNINTNKDHIDDQRKSIRSPQTMSRILKTRSGDMKDQNAFQDVLTKDDVLNASTAEKSVAFEKEFSQHSMHQNINTNKDYIDDQRKSIRALEDIETDSLTLNVEKAVPENNAETESNDESIVHRQHLKFKSRFMQQARKSIGKNAFADAVVDDSNANLSTSNLNKENNIQKSLMSRSSLNKSNANSNITPESLSIRKSSRLSLNISKKQQSDISVQDKNNIESSLSSSSLDNNESRGMKRSAFLKSKSRIPKPFRKRSSNPFEEILKQDNISDRRNNVPIEEYYASSEGETTTRINQERESLATQKNPQSENNNITNEEDSYEIFFEALSNIEKSRSKESNILSEDENKLLENNDLNNTSKSISRKSVIAKSLEEKISNRKSIREKTLKESAYTNAISPVDRLSTNKVIIQDASDDSHTYVERDVSTSESNSTKEVGLTQNSLRIRSEIPVNIEVHEANDNLHTDANREHDSSTPKRSFKLTPNKEAHLTRNSLRNRFETSKPVNIEVHEDINNSRNDANSAIYRHDSNMQLSKSNLSKEDRLTHNSLRNQSETLKPISKNTEVSKRFSNDDKDNNINVDLETSSDSTVYLITRADIHSENNTNIRTQKNTNLPTEKEITSDEDAETATQTIQRNSSSTKSGTRSKVVNQSKTLKPTSKNMEASKQSTNLIADIEEDNNINADSETSDSISHITRAEIHSKDNTNIGIEKSTILSTEKKIIGDENTEPAIQTIQRNSLTKPETSKTVNQQSMQNSNRTSIKDREIAHRKKSLGKSQNYRNTPTKSPTKSPAKSPTKSSKDTSSNKQNSSKSLKKIDDFFIKIKETSTKQLNERAQKSQVFDNEKMKKIKIELEKLKSREMAAMKKKSADKKTSAIKKETMKFVISKQDIKKKKPLMNSTKVDKAFLVYGKVYRPPRLPRPKHWATDRLYKFLWKRLEPKYKLATRVKSEKFVQELATVVAIIERCKNYENYNTELKALMKEMARLKLINTRMDFYHFCQDFLPYEFRVKVIPMSLPGNENNIPFDPKNVHTPLLDTE
ncbi:hypothetical protein ALC53_02131 [Atta colombica]|uniref:Uncharacterized protein n=1 Tax=Atta colombica TaxID=520822 RepID=A0A195BTS0_9HYME|nr:PREDICTED: extracellular matrix-binding protein ebh-like [Atta colombica]KYM89819.1 hypothetical protein ALC53_02131 [Atta colombica]